MSDGAPVFDGDRTQVVLRAGLRCFGRYTLVRKLGQGGMGIVWLGRDDKLKREVALKFLSESLRRDPEALRDLSREVRRCLELAHPNIVRVNDLVEDANLTAITMEYVPGPNLAARKAARPNGCFDAAELAPLVGQLCDALDYAHHTARIVHRDLKPSNLIVTDGGVLKIADFGIARSLAETQTRLTADSRVTSITLSFAGPQQLAGIKPAAADDIYSLGATLYDLLTGKPPFFRGDLQRQVETAAPERLGARRAELDNTGAPIPAAWEETIFACLAKRAEDRPASAGDVARRLAVSPAEIEIDPDATRQIERGKPAGAKAKHDSAGRLRLGAIFTRHKWLGLAGVALLAVLAVGFGMKDFLSTNRIEGAEISDPELQPKGDAKARATPATTAGVWKALHVIDTYIELAKGYHVGLYDHLRRREVHAAQEEALLILEIASRARRLIEFTAPRIETAVSEGSGTPLSEGERAELRSLIQSRSRHHEDFLKGFGRREDLGTAENFPLATFIAAARDGQVESIVDAQKKRTFQSRGADGNDDASGPAPRRGSLREPWSYADLRDAQRIMIEYYALAAAIGETTASSSVSERRVALFQKMEMGCRAQRLFIYAGPWLGWAQKPTGLPLDEAARQSLREQADRIGRSRDRLAREEFELMKQAQASGDTSLLEAYYAVSVYDIDKLKREMERQGIPMRGPLSGDPAK